MALTVTEKEHWKKRIEKKLDRKIEGLYAARPTFMADVQTKAREQAIESLGIADALKRREECNEQAKCLEIEAGRMTRRAAAILHGVLPDTLAGNDWHWEHCVKEAIEKRSRVTEQEILASDELGRRVLALQREKEDLLDTVWLATSPRQVRELWEDVCRLLNDEPTALQSQALGRTAVDDTDE